jgi:hypothetical protein
MADTLLLDRTAWDLVLDSSGNIAVATEPYSLAQDAASAIMTYSDGGPNGIGEVFWNSTLGVPYLTVIFRGPPPSISTIKQLFVNAAMTVPDVASAQVFITAASNRALTGQVQVTSASTGQVSAAPFAIQNPQGIG